MTDGFNDWLDRVADGEKPTVASFAQSAITDRPKRIETRARPPMNKGMWPPKIWAEMQAIKRGERD